MIGTLTDFDAFCNDQTKMAGSDLKLLSDEELAFFRYNLEFDDRGNVRKIYFGDLAAKGLSEDKIAEVAALFGIDEKRFKRTYNYFGDAQGHCLSRPHFWCPY